MPEYFFFAITCVLRLSENIFYFVTCLIFLALIATHITKLKFY